MEQQVGGAAERHVGDHGVVDCGLGQDVVGSQLQLVQMEEGDGGAACGIEPDGGSRGGEGGVGEGHSQGFCDDLGGGGGAEKLAASSGSGAGAAAHFGGGFEGDLLLRVTGADGLDFAGVFSVFGEQGDSTGNEDGRERAGRGQGHHHGGKSFVAGGDADDTHAGGERAHEAAQDDGGIVAVGQGVEHAGGALGASIAGVGAGSGEGDGVEGFEGDGGFRDQGAEFPVAGVEAESDGSAVGGAKSSMGAEDEDFLAQQLLWFPTHSGVLAETEEITGGGGEQHFRSDGENAAGARGVGGYVVQLEGGGFQDLFQGDGSGHGPIVRCRDGGAAGTVAGEWESALCHV